MTKYLVALPLPDAQSKSFLTLRNNYAKYAPRWKITLKPHITIIRPTVSAVDESSVINSFKSIDPNGLIRMGFDGFGAFVSKKNCVVFAEPNRHSPFSRIREQYLSEIKKVLEIRPDRWEYHPHLTLVNRLTRVNAIAVLEEIYKQRFLLNYKFDRVCLYSKSIKDEMWVEKSCVKFTS